MSKSKGNIIPALKILEKYGNDAVRFYFLKDGPLDRDELFNPNQLVDNYNAHLVNEFTNSIRRVSSPQFLPPPGTPLVLSPANNKRDKDFIVNFNIKVCSFYFIFSKCICGHN